MREAISPLTLLCKDLLLGSEPVLLFLFPSEPVLLFLVGFTATAFIQLIVSIGLDHGHLWVLWTKRNELQMG
jgi:hypothetical protein